MLQRALDGKNRHKDKPSPSPKTPVNEIIDRLAHKLLEVDAEASAEAVVEGIMAALTPDILGDAFVAPARSTVSDKVAKVLRSLEPEGEPEPSTANEPVLEDEFICLEGVPF
jgi:hypothetical protein